MPGSSTGLHSKRIGYKQKGSAPVEYFTFLINTTITFDPPSLLTGAFATSSPITVTGVLLGDRVELFPPYDTQGIMYQATPQAADKITINLTSCAAGTVDLASGTWRVQVIRGA